MQGSFNSYIYSLIMQKDKNNEKLVKLLYEQYPYPSRKDPTEKKVKQFVKWVSTIFNKDFDFWNSKTVLELGCGTGELANGLALCGANVHAIDFSSSSIKKAKELSKKLNTKIKFEEQNILNFNSSQKFDVVIALGSLHHTINAKKGFENGAHCLKKNGIIIVGLYNKYSRFRQRIRRAILWILCGKDIEKRIDIGKKLFGSMESREQEADKYGQVWESYHSVKEVLRWFSENNIEFISSKPKFKKPIIDEIKWLFGKKGAFFVMVGKAK